MTPQTTSFDIYDLNGFHYQHVPEVDITWEMSNKNTQFQKVQRRILKHKDYDFRRYWELTTVWFDHMPVMIVQNAGREGDDHSARFITNPDVYFKMVSYLRSLIDDANDQLNNDLVDPHLSRDDLLTFYNEGLYIKRPENIANASDAP